MLNVYIADLTGLEESYEEKVNRLHRERADKLNAYKMPADRVRSLGAGLLLEKGLEDYLQCAQVQMQGNENANPSIGNIYIPRDEEGRCIIKYGYGPQGKPYLEDYPGICFSLSHSGNKVVLALSDSEVGIDVQENRGYNEKIAKRFYHKVEYKILEQAESVSECERLFYRIWTGKEAFIKYTGKGMKQDMRSFYVNLEQGCIVSEDGKFVKCETVEMDSNVYFCSLVFDKKIQKTYKIVKMNL